MNARRQGDALAPIRELLARYQAWDGDPDYTWVSSPKQREELRAAIVAAESDGGAA